MAVEIGAPIMAPAGIPVVACAGLSIILLFGSTKQTRAPAWLPENELEEEDRFPMIEDAHKTRLYLLGEKTVYMQFIDELLTHIPKDKHKRLREVVAQLDHDIMDLDVPLGTDRNSDISQGKLGAVEWLESGLYHTD